MADSIPKNAVARTADRLLGEVYPGLGAVPRAACRALFLAVVRTGQALVRDIARTMYDGSVCMKGLQEKVSGWLGRYDFLTGAAQWLWRRGVALVSRDTFIALDSSDISKEFGGRGMEGMEMGYDASRGVAAMGHNILCAAVVTRRRAMPLCMRLLRGRHGLPDAETRLYDELLDRTGGDGIPVEDRGFDNEQNVAHVCRRGHRTVIRVCRLDRDVFGTGRAIDADMSGAPAVQACLSSPTRRARAVVRWRVGHFPCGESHRRALVVSSTFDGTTLYLYALNFVTEAAGPAEMSAAARLAANAYFNRWSVEVFFQAPGEPAGALHPRVRLLRARPAELRRGVRKAHEVHEGEPRRDSLRLQALRRQHPRAAQHRQAALHLGPPKKAAPGRRHAAAPAGLVAQGHAPRHLIIYRQCTHPAENPG